MTHAYPNQKSVFSLLLPTVRGADATAQHHHVSPLQRVRSPNHKKEHQHLHADHL